MNCPKILISFILITLSCCSLSNKSNKPINQYPSPMEEKTRRHERVPNEPIPGNIYFVDRIFEKPIEIFVPKGIQFSDDVSLLIHFHGASYVAKYAVTHCKQPVILANINLGGGSSTYETPFIDGVNFFEIVNAVKHIFRQNVRSDFNFQKILISSFSAGYGSVRAILRNQQNYQLIDGIILLDGLHTDYIPEKTVLAEGGQLNTEKLTPFLNFAKLAANGEKAFIITHSEIFPGTYASTTETADFLVNALDLQRKPVLKWGPTGMQQISEASQGRLEIFGFAGNSARDHVDHFHALHHFLNLIIDN